jgi:stage II sporulation protein AA (anti-sigma F factor antagonist)
VNNSTFDRQTINKETILINPGTVLDNNNAHEMVDLITRAHNEGYKYIVINMSQLEFLSSAGVGSILGTIEIFREKGGDIILCNVSRVVYRILQVLDLSDYLTIKENEKKALSLCQVEA